MNRTNFYPQQVPTSGEMNQCFDQVESAVNAITLRGIGYGWQYGATVGINQVDPRSLDIYAFQGNGFPSGITMQSDSTLNLKTTHSGYTGLGAAGQADGSAISVSDGYRMWVNIMVVADINESDVRVKNGINYYWLKTKTFKFRITPGAQALSSGFPALPAIPAEEGSYLILCDVLLKNTGGTTVIEMIDNGRRTKWKGGKLGHLYLGTPAFLSECKLKAVANWSAGNPIDIDNLFDPDDGLIPDVIGGLVWTKKGAFLKQRIAGENDGLILSYPIINPGTANVTKNITFKSKPHAVSGGGDFMELYVVSIGAPYDAITKSWAAASAIPATTFKQGTVETVTHSITFSPGRNLLRVYARNISPENNLTLCISTGFIDHTTIYPDTEMLEGILHYNIYFPYTSDII